jgi:hypothetical protein
VESLTALAEHTDGTLEILRWSERSTTTPPAQERFVALQPAHV